MASIYRWHCRCPREAPGGFSLQLQCHCHSWTPWCDDWTGVFDAKNVAVMVTSPFSGEDGSQAALHEAIPIRGSTRKIQILLFSAHAESMRRHAESLSRELTVALPSEALRGVFCWSRLCPMPVRVSGLSSRRCQCGNASQSTQLLLTWQEEHTKSQPATKTRG